MAKEQDITKPQNLVLFPGVRRETIPTNFDETVAPEPELTSKKVLQGAIDRGIEDAVVVGWTPDGSLYVASECGDPDAVAGKLLRAANYFASLDIEEEFIDE